MYWQRGNPKPNHWPDFLKEADIEWCRITAPGDGSPLIWHEGKWLNGKFKGVWKNGYWVQGTFQGTWENGTWLSGDFQGTWLAGTWLGGSCLDCEWLGGAWLGGDWGLRRGARGEVNTYLSANNSFSATLRCWKVDVDRHAALAIICQSTDFPRERLFEGALSEHGGALEIMSSISKKYDQGEHLRELEVLILSLQKKYMPPSSPTLKRTLL